MKVHHKQDGFILPLTMIFSLMALALVLHAILLLNSNRSFFQSVYSDFQLRQLRENTLAEIDRSIQEKTLPESGSIVYDIGTATFKKYETVNGLEVKFTVNVGKNAETDKIVYDQSNKEMIGWQERIDP
ncbi:competence type IV pilus minor pilin ComGG [Sporolactobacillus pectinivorans]|uniref:competence type IV pilus minor pilin ComGG n=1 Tax=Sporolactobacillus pectinivorans TaxID=1591408 RepID=UPI000C256176|nr:competence type IV pilus minor pilin ComGG [Sporolactobacillus pectinivorans]